MVNYFVAGCVSVRSFRKLTTDYWYWLLNYKYIIYLVAYYACPRRKLGMGTMLCKLKRKLSSHWMLNWPTIFRCASICQHQNTACVSFCVYSLLRNKRPSSNILFMFIFAVECYECPESETGCNKAPLENNDTISICPIGLPGVGCWVKAPMSSDFLLLLITMSQLV